MATKNFIGCINQCACCFFIGTTNVVDPYIEATEFFNSRCGNVLRKITNVTSNGEGTLAAFTNACSRFIEVALAPRVQNNIAASIGKRPCNTATNTLAGSGDDSYLAVHPTYVKNAHGTTIVALAKWLGRRS